MLLHVPTSSSTPPTPMMSVAVSAQVKPSASLFVMVTLLALALASIGALVSLGVVGNLAPTIGIVLGFFSMSVSIWGWLGYRRTRRSLRIIITGNGQIKIIATDTGINMGIGNAIQTPVIAHLLSGSTLWTGLLLLRFQLDNGRIKSVVILPDCVPEDVFKALSVACRWVASHGRSDGLEKVIYEQPIG